MKVIFHHPNKLFYGDSGSTIRPIKVVESLREKGREVFEITGTRREREQRFRTLRGMIEGGETFGYMYSEGLSRPINLAIRNTYGIKSLRKEKLDLEIIDFALSAGIPVGYYLRDLHWDFFDQAFGHQNALKYRYLKYRMQKFGEREIEFLKNRNLTVFCPSGRFARHLMDRKNLSALPLPPGATEGIDKVRTPDFSHLKLVYVGGVKGVYDLSHFLNDLRRTTGASLTLCTRSSEWGTDDKAIPNLTVVHCSGSELTPLYRDADLAVYPARSTGYINLAFSLKIPEYIANGLPILAYAGSEISDFIENRDIGWIMDHETRALPSVIEHIRNHPEEYARKQANVLKLRPTVTWRALVDNMEQHILPK